MVADISCTNYSLSSSSVEFSLFSGIAYIFIVLWLFYTPVWVVSIPKLLSTTLAVYENFYSLLRAGLSIIFSMTSYLLIQTKLVYHPSMVLSSFLYTLFNKVRTFLQVCLIPNFHFLKNRNLVLFIFELVILHVILYRPREQTFLNIYLFNE